MQEAQSLTSIANKKKGEERDQNPGSVTGLLHLNFHPCPLLSGVSLASCGLRGRIPGEGGKLWAPPGGHCSQPAGSQGCQGLRGR